MDNRLHQRDFLKEIDFTPEDLSYLLDLAAQLKRAKKARREPKFLSDKNIVILFEKDSTRTRCSFEVAAYDQGARVTYLGPSGSQMGKKESMSTIVALFGAFTFVATCILAVSQSNAKKVLAYSTIANLGLIIACVGINTAASRLCRLQGSELPSRGGKRRRLLCPFQGALL